MKLKKTRNNRIVWTDEADAELVKRRQAGATLDALGLVFGVADCSIKARLRILGVSSTVGAPNRYDWTKLDPILARMRHAGKSWRDIARRLGVAPATVEKRWHDAHRPRPEAEPVGPTIEDINLSRWVAALPPSHPVMREVARLSAPRVTIAFEGRELRYAP